MIDLRKITATEWARDINNPHGIVTGPDVVNQEIDVLLATPPGSIPGEPTKGVSLEGIIDKPMFDAIPESHKRIPTAVARFIPRIEVKKFETIPDGSTLHMVILWKYKNRPEIYKKEVQI